MRDWNSRYKATVSARHSSMDDDTSPRTEPGVWPGLYHEVLRIISDESCNVSTSCIYIFPPVRGFTICKQGQCKWASYNSTKKQTFSGSKFFVPSAYSSNSFPEPCPKSSWFATCTSKALLSQALYRSTSSGWMKVNSSSTRREIISTSNGFQSHTRSFGCKDILEKIKIKNRTAPSHETVPLTRRSWNLKTLWCRNNSVE